jgi:hypothetical protein
LTETLKCLPGMGLSAIAEMNSEMAEMALKRWDGHK